ncbi:tyrosine-type recombinase/integrase [Oceanobacillus timonensis]|uniref:site-specific integrase n=1 Tax=Oceanobacillus timonensis TaxID=1926285 RepID=UPI0009B9EB44|nr:tyrosine-type recombinase/integrase [Oceanobacillus timonensis]
MASFTKRGKTWQYTISRMVNGKSKPIRKSGFRTKKEAQIAAAEIENKMNRGMPVHLKLEPIDEYFEQWANLYKNHVSKGTRQLYDYTLNYIKEYFQDTPLQHINYNEYQAFINKLGESYSRETVKKVNSHIRACVRDAMDDGIIHIDFTRKVVLSGKDGKRAIEKHLQYSESQTLLHALFDYLEKEHRSVYYIILLALTSGMRFAEMAALTRKDFDFVNNTIDVNKSWGYLPTTENGVRITKTESSNRVINMDPRTMKVFKKFFEEVPENIHQLVFFNPASKYKIYSNTGVNKALRKLFESLELDGVSIHGLRHTYASVLLYKDVSIQYISEQLGHSDVDTTIRVYTHLLKEKRYVDRDKATRIFSTM